METASPQLLLAERPTHHAAESPRAAAHCERRAGQRHDEPVELALHEPARDVDRSLAGRITVRSASVVSRSEPMSNDRSHDGPRSGRPIASCVEPPPTSQTATAPSSGPAATTAPW